MSSHPRPARFVAKPHNDQWYDPGSLIYNRGLVAGYVDVGIIASMNPQPDQVRLYVMKRHLMGEQGNEGLRLGFDERTGVQFVGSKIRSDAELLVYREWDGKLRAIKHDNWQ